MQLGAGPILNGPVPGYTSYPLTLLFDAIKCHITI